MSGIKWPLDTNMVIGLLKSQAAAIAMIKGGSAQLDSIFHFLSGSLAVNAYAAFGSADRLSK